MAKFKSSLKISLPALSIVILAYLLIPTAPLFAGARPQAEEPAWATLEIRYHLPNVEEVFLVWGINGWQSLPKETQPPETLIKDKLMRTPLRLKGDFFVAQVQVPIGATLDYGFLITQKRTGPAIKPIWEGGEGYHKLVQADGVIELESQLNLAQSRPSSGSVTHALVNQEIHYKIPEAGEVFLLWGINGWQPVPEEIRPTGTVVQDDVMHTPMKPATEAFIATLRVPVGTILNYGFLVTKNNKGIEIESVWQGSGDQDYHTIATQDSVVELEASTAVIRKVAIEEPDLQLLQITLLFLTALCLPLAALVIVRVWHIPAQMNLGVVQAKDRRPLNLAAILDTVQQIDFPKLRQQFITPDLLKLIVVLTIITLAGLSIVSHYGLSTDEPPQIQMVWDNFDLIAEGERFQWEGEYYGPVFNLIAEIVFHFQKYLSLTLSNDDQTTDSQASLKFENRLMERIKVKHPVTFLFSLLAYISVAGLIGIICGWKYGWFGAVVLVLFPRFWGHSFFNPKDSPFAAMFIFSTFMGAYLLGHYAKKGDDLKIGFNSTTVLTTLYGILVGLLTGIRIGGFIMIFFIGLVYLMIRLGKKINYLTFVHAGALHLVMAIAWLATTTLVHPSAWSNPIGWLFEALAYQSSHPWSKDVLFDSHYIPAQQLPWYYLLKWVTLTVPLIFQISIILGLVLIMSNYRALSDIQRAAIMLVLLQIFFLPFIAMIKDSTIYDGMRQFLFILPGMAVIAGISLLWLYEKLPTQKIRLLAVICLAILFAQIGFDMITLHPYEYIYFDRFMGGLRGAQHRYETDYWGLSMREGIEWINKNSGAGTNVVVGGPFYYAVKLFADPDLTIIQYDHFKKAMISTESFYYLAAPKHRAQGNFPECKTVYQVIRQETPLAIVKQCEHTPLLAAGLKQEQDTSLVTQEIHYYNPEAGEVFFVWGINGWQPAPAASHPAGTTIKNKVLHTSMQVKDETFIIKLQLPRHTTLDYGFLVTQHRNGAKIQSVWDGDYQTNISDGDMAEVEASSAAAQQLKTYASRAAGASRQRLLIIIAIGAIFSAYALSSLPYFQSRKSARSISTVLKVGAILAVAALLRFNHIRQPLVDAFSWRQASTAMMAANFYHESWNIFYPAVSWGGPELSYQGREFQTVSYLSALLYTMFGQHDWIGRSVAILFGVWGVFALYLLIRRVWDEEHALAGAAIMALLPGAIFIERSFLPDPAMVALVVTSFWLFVLYLQTDQLRYLLLAAFIGAWGLLSKLPGLIAGLPMVYTMLTILGRKNGLNRQKCVTIGTMAIFVLIPVVGYYLWVRHLSLTYPPYHFAGSGHWLWDQGLSAWLAQGYFLSGLYWNLEAWFWTEPIMVLLFMGLLFPPLGWQSRQALKPEQKPTDYSDKAPWLFHLWLLAGLVYYLIGARELVYNSWNFHIISPAVAALGGRGLFLITSLVSRKVRWLPAPITITILLSIIIIFGQLALQQMYYPQKPLDATEGYKMGLALRQISKPGDLVVTIPNDIGEPVAIYYSQRRGWIFPPAINEINWAKLPADDHQAIRLFEELRANGADWFAIVDDHRAGIRQDLPLFTEHIEDICEIQVETSDYVIYRILSVTETVRSTSPTH